MSENIEHVLAVLDGFRMSDEMTYSAYSVLHDEISMLDDLLKAQEPRVMTLKEIVSAECVWIEYATSGNVVIALPWDIELTDDTYNFIGMPNCFVEFRSLYGKTWRCWTSRPTEVQREAAKWE